MDKKEHLAVLLHKWHLEATQTLNPTSYNRKAQKHYDDLSEDQKFIDRYIAGKVLENYQEL